MNNLVSQILFAMLLPVVLVVFTISLFAFVDFMSISPPAVGMGLIVFAFAWLYWSMLWRRTVHWNARRVWLTIVLTAACVAAIAGPGLLIDWGLGDEGFTFVFTSLSILAFLMLSIVIWRDMPAERVAWLRMQAGRPVRCPKCGYDMTGLHEARCPECGAVFTLDQLLAAQQGDQLRDVPAPGRPDPHPTESV